MIEIEELFQHLRLPLYTYYHRPQVIDSSTLPTQSPVPSTNVTSSSPSSNSFVLTPLSRPQPVPHQHIALDTLEHLCHDRLLMHASKYMEDMKRILTYGVSTTKMSMSKQPRRITPVSPNVKPLDEDVSIYYISVCICLFISFCLYCWFYFLLLLIMLLYLLYCI